MWASLLVVALAALWHADVDATVDVETLTADMKNIMNCTPVKTKTKAVCAGRVGEHTKAPNMMNLSTFKSHYCYCDADCHVFSDCCTDVANFTGPWDRARAVKGFPRDSWACLTIKLARESPNNELPMMHMIGSCPAGHDFAARCSKVALPADDVSYMLDVPVMHEVTGVWFRNIYCAMCNDVHVDDLAPMNRTLKCSDESIVDHATAVIKLANATYNDGELSWEWLDDDFVPMLCKLDVTPVVWSSRLPQANQSVPGFYRPCFELTDSCPVDYHNASVVEWCSSFTHYIQVTKKSVYKNHYCALCNGVSGGRLMCWKPSTFRTVENQNQRILPTLSSIMDFDWNFKDSGKWKESNKCLPPLGIFDVIHNKCQSTKTICKVGFHFVNNACVRDVSANETSEMIDDDTASRKNDSRFISCPKTKLLEEEFHILENGSLRLTVKSSQYYNYVFSANDFEMDVDGTASVCWIFGSKDARIAEGILTIVCLTISVVCLGLHFIAYGSITKLRNLPGKNLMALSCALFVAQLIFLLGVHPVVGVSHTVCQTIAVVIFYFYLSAFFWMNVMSFDIWRKFSTTMQGSSSTKLHAKYAAYAWGVPALIVLLSVVVEAMSLLPEFARPNYGFDDVCWFGSPLGLGIFFTGPVVVILVVNLFFFTSTVTKIVRQMRESAVYIRKKTRDELVQTRARTSGLELGAVKVQAAKREPSPSERRDHVRFYLYVKLFTIMGLTWLFGFIAAFAHAPSLWYPFTVFNGLQGAFIFVMFDWKRDIGLAMWEKTLGRRYEAPEFLKAKSKSDSSTASKKTSRSSTNTNSSGLRTSGSLSIHNDADAVVSVPDPHQMVRIRLNTIAQSDEALDKYKTSDSEEELMEKPPRNSPSQRT